MAMGAPSRVYEDTDPASEVISEPGHDILRVNLPGFRKDQLRVQLTTTRLLKISGERPLGGNKWTRFHKEFLVPPHCDTKEITAKFENGILYIKLPKLITPTTTEDQVRDTNKPTSEPQQTEPKPQPQPKAEGEEEKPSKNEEKKKDETVLTQASKEGLVARGVRYFKEMKDKEDVMKRVGLPLLVMLGLGFFILYTFQSFEDQRVFDQEL